MAGGDRERGGAGRDAEDRQLAAYHDGELRGLARWRMERRLRHDPELRRELERLARIRAAVRDAAAGASAPDLWDRIALRLPAADAAREEARDAASARGRWLLAAPLTLGAAATAATGVALLFASGPAPLPAPESAGVVRWMSAGKRSVFVREEPGPQGATIIWILHDPSEMAAARRRPGDVV